MNFSINILCIKIKKKINKLNLSSVINEKEIFQGALMYSNIVSITIVVMKNIRKPSVKNPSKHYNQCC